MVVDSSRGRIYIAGGKGKLVAIDFKTGKIVSSVDIAVGADQIAYDAKSSLIYSACKGFISVTKATEKGLEVVGNVTSPKGAHTLAVDPKTHDVWVSFSDKEHSYVQKFSPIL